MSEKTPPRHPPRLSGEGGELGRILTHAEPEFRRGLSESGAFRRLERTRRQRTVLSWAAGTAVLAAGVLLSVRALQPEDRNEIATLSPERLGPPPKQALPPPEPEPAPPPSDPAPASARVVSEAPRVAPAVEAPSPVPSEPLCQKLGREGKNERAVECYRALGRNGGVAGEVALYNAARTSFDALGNAPQTLALLDEHHARFPATALRAEVGWLRVRSLKSAGRSEEALTESEALLASPSGRSLAADLHWLRAKIYQDERGDCARAVSELVALVGEPGERGDEAELRRARCLEKLGRSTDARAAYQHYLERPDARNAEEARRRLSDLSD